MRAAKRPLIGAAGALAVTALVTLAGCGGDDAGDQERERAVSAAMEAYAQARDQEDDLAAGPCIAERLPDLDDWVVDIAHDPRQDIDDRPENQCRRYRDGDASHFVELTPDGELIRAE